jgi:hypothetical protein
MVAPAVVVHPILVTQLQMAEVRQHQQPVLGLHMETSARVEVVEPVVLAAALGLPDRVAPVVGERHFWAHFIRLVVIGVVARVRQVRAQVMVEALPLQAAKEVME